MSTNVEYTTIPDMIWTTVQQFGKKTALIDPVGDNEYQEMTYQDMWALMMQVSSFLLKQNVNPGDRVGLLAEGRSWWPICDVGIMATGAWTVPIYPSLPGNQVQHIVRHAGMKGIFVQDKKQLDKLLSQDGEGRECEERLELEFVVILDSADIDSKPSSYPWPVISYTDLFNETAASVEVKERMTKIGSSDVATIIYTSGTTGLPKGVLLTHGNLLANLQGIQQVIEIQSTDRTLSYLPLSHVFERTCGQFALLKSGATIAYSRGFQYIADDFLKMPPTIFTTVPRLLEKVYEKVMKTMENGPAWKRKLLRRAVSLGVSVRIDGQMQSAWKLAMYDRVVFSKIKAALGGQLRMVVSGGAPLPAYIGRFFMAAGVPIIEGYGMTETSPVIAVNPPGRARLGTVGRVLKNVSVKIADDGELLVKGPSITQGYYKDEAATEEAFTSDGWLRTGDMAELSSDNYLKITDRKKNLLVLSTGKKVTPAPIEADILKNPFIDQVLLIGQGRKFVSVLVVPSSETVSAWLHQKGRAVPMNLWANDEEIKALLFTEVNRETAGYAEFEQPKKILVVTEPFSIENGQLTPTLKVRAKSVLTAYAKEIDALYGVTGGEPSIAATRE